jgi:G3E family GTPase
MSTHIPVILVSGFLGAGKTTLMRRLILDAREKNIRIAVIVNEFGASDVDSNILRELEREAERSGEAASEILSGIAGGCACCSGQAELHQTLLEIGERLENRPDVILMEASGLADPVLLLDVITAAQLLPLLEIGGMISVADASRMQYLQSHLAPLLRRQTQLADLVVLNKSDVAESGQVEAWRHALMSSRLRIANSI